MSDFPPYIHIGPEPELPPLGMMSIGYESRLSPVIHRPSVIAPISLPEPEPVLPARLTVDVRKFCRTIMADNKTPKWKRKLLAKFLIRLETKKRRRTYKRPPQFRKHGHPRKQKGRFN